MVFFTVHPSPPGPLSWRKLWLLMGIMGLLCGAGAVLGRLAALPHQYSVQPVASTPVQVPNRL
jgi:hypothetical protein